MKTMERPREEVSTPKTPTQARVGWGMTGLVAVLALVLGALGSWAVFGLDDDPTAIAAGGGELTERQEEMVAVLDDYTNAWDTSDGAAALETMTPTAFVTFDNTSWRVEDGTLVRNIESGLYGPSLDHLDPILVEGNAIVAFHRYGGLEVANVFEFTNSGEVLITQHTMVR